MADFNKADLAKILEQIRISEQHRTREGANGAPIAGTPLTALISNPLLPQGLRQVDGRNNNLVPGREEFGAADTVFKRALPPVFRPGDNGTTYDSDSGIVVDSDPRTISNYIVDQTLDNVAAIAAAIKHLGLTETETVALARDIKAEWDDLKSKFSAARLAAAAEAAALIILTTEQSQVDAAVATLDAYNNAIVSLGDVDSEFTETNDAIAALAPSVGLGDLVNAALSLVDAVIANAQQAAAHAAAAAQTLNADPSARQVDKDAASDYATAVAALVSDLQAFKAGLGVAGDVVDQADVDALAAINTLLTTTLVADLNTLNGDLDGQSIVWVGNVATETSERDTAQSTYDQNVLTSDTADAAVTAAKALLDGSLAASEISIEQKFRPASLQGAPTVLDEYGSIVLTNVAPDEGISAPFNSWMTLFGQFFDHGLDLVSKGQSGTVFIPLLPDDPLYVEGSPTNFMTLTRATNQPGADGVLGTDDDIHEHTNTTTAWVDQNQTYTSHSSHQVFLRDYDRVGGQTVATGHLLDGAAGTMPTWAEVKAQALEMLGLKLSDFDINNVPLLATDEYGRFLRGPNGYAQVVIAVNGVQSLVEGTAVGLDLAALDAQPGTDILRTGHAFLDDISHAANPYDGATGARKIEDGDTSVGVTTVANSNFVAGFVGPETWQLEKRANVVVNPLYDGTPPPIGTLLSASQIQDRPFLKTSEVYDGELLGRHFMTGDGRGNENIGLTAVHDVFHSEHNRLSDQVKDIAIAAAQAGDMAFLNEWLRVDITSLPANLNTLQWDGERLFQAARFGTEMQYQHLVFEEFARKVVPGIDLFVFNPTIDVDPSIFAEFAHVVYRFGHSMLNEQVDRVFDANTQESMTLVDAFLNPLAFNTTGNGTTITADEATGALVRGMTRQAGNEIDEYVTDALRNFLVGVPLDLPALNIARGRDAGVPSLNKARETFFVASNNSEWMRPYEGWSDFKDNLKNPLSIINFISAYGTHASLLSIVDTGTGLARALTMQEKRDAALLLVFGDGDGNSTTTIHGIDYDNQDVADFLNGTGAYANAGADGLGGKGGMDDVDMWIGGLAEAILPFGGMLGSTFTFVFEKQMENLQNGDRFYYLSRTQGMHFLTELESNSFAELIMNNTDLKGAHLPGEIFSTPNYVLEVNTAVQNDYNGTELGVDPLSGVSRTNVAVDGQTYDTYLRFTGGEHVVLGGTDANDALIAGIGDDTVWGDAGNDVIKGDAGINRLHGGDGNDLIYDGGDASFLHGEDGDDFISAGAGAGDLIFGDAGNDYILMGSDLKEAFGGEGNDFILGTAAVDIILGGEGDDWLEGGEGFDTLAGDNSELFFNSAIIGHDVLFAGTDENDFDAESGDDIMVQGESVMRNEGMFGFDWSIWKGNALGANADLRARIVNVPNDILRNRFDKTEALSGWENDDRLVGDNRVAPTAVFDPNLVPNESEFFGDGLDRAGVNRIAGLRELLGLTEAQVSGDQSTIVFEAGNILIGGDGDDFMQGNGGNDIIDGDRWLNVRIGIVIDGVEVGTVERLAVEEIALSGVPPMNLVTIYPDAMNDFGAWHGKSITELIETRQITGSNMQIRREILSDTTAGDTDTAAFRGARAEYDVVRNPDGSLTVTHTAVVQPIDNDGVDTLRGIERLHFADGGLFTAAIDENTNNSGGLLVGNMTREFASGTVAFGGPDASRFSYNSTTGEIRFTQVGLNFEGPVDANDNGVYVATLLHTDGVTGAIYTDNIEVTVRNVNEASAGALSIGSGVGLPVGGANPETAVRLTVTDTRTDLDLIRVGNPTGLASLSLGTSYQWQRFNGTTWDNVVNSATVTGANTAIVSGLSNGRFRLQSTVNDGFAPVVAFSDEAFVGTAGNNATLNGLATNDWLFGLAGNDVLNGGLGADTMVGGLGNDTYNVDNVGDVVQETNTEGIADLVNASITFNLATSGINIERLTLTGASAINGIGNDGNNVIIGNNAANTLDGGLGADTLTGNGGDDNLDGGIGADSMVGGAGNDTYTVDNIGDVVTEGASATDLDDRVISSLTFSLATLANIEHLTLTGTGAINGTGNAANNAITGNEADNILDGGLGNDTLHGGGGVDTLLGGVGYDIASYASASAGVAVDLTAQNSWDGTSMDFLSSVEGAIGSAFSDTIYGGADDNVLEGLGAVDFLYGLGGSDSVSYRSTAQGVYVDLTAQHSWDGSAMDFYASIENVIGSAHSDSLYGGADDNVFEGGGGIDFIYGLGGSDSISYRSWTQGVQVDLTSQTGFNGTSTAFLTSIENAIGSAFGDNIHGSTGSNRFEGLAGNDTIAGAGGDDIFIYRAAGTGADMIVDFDADATSGQDLIDLSGRGFSAASIGGAIVVAASDVTGNHTLITIGSDSILLLNVAAANVTATDFVF